MIRISPWGLELCAAKERTCRHRRDDAIDAILAAAQSIN